MEPIRSRDVRVLGRVVGLMRSISCPRRCPEDAGAPAVGRTQASGAPGRLGSEAAPPLFGDGVEAAVEAPADVRAPDAPQAAAAGSPRGRREGRRWRSS